MKTPKRYPATMSVYASKDELYQDRARWKRKNRVAQYKHTIAKLNRELAMFTDNFDLIAEALVALSEHSDSETRNACADLLISLAR